MDSKTSADAPGWRGYFFNMVFGLLAIAAILAHRAAAPLLLLLAFAAPHPKIVFNTARAAFPPAIRSGYGLLFYCALVFSLWTAATALWSPLPEKIDWSWRYGFAFFVGGLALYASLALAPIDKARARAGFAWAVLAMAALLVFERLTGGALRALFPPDQLPVNAQISQGRGALILMVLVWPAREIFARRLARPLLGWALIGAAAIVAAGFSIEVNGAALAFGFAAFWLARRFARATLNAVFSLLIASIWLAPLIAATLPVEALRDGLAAAGAGLPTSWLQRLYIWQYAGAEIAAHPMGGGVDYARSLAAGAPRIEINGVTGSAMPLHPHNLALHFWIDLGVIGAMQLTAALMAIYKSIKSSRINAGDYPLIAAIMMSFFATAMIDWSMWQVWRFALCWFAAIGCALAIGGEGVRQGNEINS